MKKLIILLIIVCGFTPALRAMGSPNQHLSPKEFRAKQQAFITEKAGLTQEEAAKFFPVYFELQDRKKQLNDEAWKLLRSGKDEKTTDTQYGEILEGNPFVQENLSGAKSRDAFPPRTAERST